MRRALLSQAAHNKRLERTRHQRASLLSCVGARFIASTLGIFEERSRICLSSLRVQLDHASYSSMFVPEGGAK